MNEQDADRELESPQVATFDRSELTLETVFAADPYKSDRGIKRAVRRVACRRILARLVR